MDYNKKNIIENIIIFFSNLVKYITTRNEFLITTNMFNSILKRITTVRL